MSVVELDTKTLLNIWKWMLEAREVDRLEAELVNRGEAFFHVSGTGHEGSAALAPHLIPADWLHCHYRDKALLIARGVPPEMFFDSSLCRANSHSRGRQMSAHLSDPAHNVLSIVGPVGNNALQAAGVAAQVKHQPERPIVLCGMGDGMSQQGEVLEAIAEAVRSTLPVLFFVHDNRLAISTTTPGNTFYWLPDGPAEMFYGLEIHRLDGRHPMACVEPLAALVGEMRQNRKPAIVVFEVERLASHTNADDERVYRPQTEIKQAWATGDPLQNAMDALLAMGVSRAELEAAKAAAIREVAAASERSRKGPCPEACTTAKSALPEQLAGAREHRGDASEPRLSMKQAINAILRQRLQSDARVTLYGEDIEDPKGDVFGITSGLSTQFPGRVLNSPLSESTIAGVSIGRALAGGRPVAFLQFADFLPIAFNQIATEMATMYWRTDGGWTAPVIVMAPCGGLKPGLGPFHAETHDSTMAHLPGVDVFMPSTAADAAGLLNAAFESGRPTIFLYPKNLLNNPAFSTSADTAAQLVPIGTARRVQTGSDITLLGWGNAVSQCEGAARALESAGISVEIFDLRCLSPWDEDAMLASAEKTGRMVVVHEDNHSCGMGAEIVATMAERARRPVAMRRVTRPDTYVPCNFDNQLEVLPSIKTILAAACDLLGLEFHWENAPESDPGLFVVEAIGSSPADSRITVIDLLVKQGQQVAEGDALAYVEADKASADVSSPVSGTVEEILAEEGDQLHVGAPLMRIRMEAGAIRKKAGARELPGTPVIRVRSNTAPEKVPEAGVAQRRALPVGLCAIGTALGSRRVTNEELACRFGKIDAANILRRTGIESRPWVGEGENALTLAVKAAEEALDAERIDLHQIELIICSTGTPLMGTPSMSNLLLHDLCKTRGKHNAASYDIKAACSGYLYALQIAYDYLQSQPDARILIVTTEALSTQVDPDDFSTSIVFADAATATICSGENHASTARALVSRPLLHSDAEDGTLIQVPCNAGQGGYIHMAGGKVLPIAVNAMANTLRRACAESRLDPADLDMILPHQSSQRVIDGVRQQLDVPREKTFSNIRHLGNTSSNTIPLALHEILPSAAAGTRIGLCAFGGGFTYGAAILTVQ